MKGLIATVLFGLLAAPAFAQQAPPAPGIQNAPEIPFDSVPFLKLTPERNLGEVLGVAVNSKGHVVVLNHPGSAGTGPVYGESTTQIMEFDEKGNFVREIGRGVYGLAYAHSVRFDKYDNLWVVDKATMSVMKFDPQGMVVMNLGRRDEGPDEPRYRHADPPPTPVDGYFNGSTDVTWDKDDNIYVSDGYFNSEIAKFDKHGYWLKRWGAPGKGGEHANENPGRFSNPHNIGIDRNENIYVADRGNRRIQVFDTEGNFKKFIFLDVPYDKTRHPVLGNMPATRPDETRPWTICITNTTPQYLYTSDEEPGRIYKLSLPDGKILGLLGKSGREIGQFSWVHGIACPDENMLYVADMNNWRLQKLILHPDKKLVSTK
jgi:DNA-binding beta-propeller fold protein YncE